MIKQLLSLGLLLSLTASLSSSPVQNVVLADFELASPAPTLQNVTAANSSAGASSFSANSYVDESGSRRLQMTDPGGAVNGVVVTIPGAFTEAGFYLITTDIKVNSTAGAGAINTFGMAAKVGGATTARVDDANAAYVLNLPDNPTNGAALGYQTIGAGIQVPAGGTFPKDLTLYFSTDPSGEPGDAHADFNGPHRGSATALSGTNTSSILIDNIKRIGPGNFGEERHLWISVGDGFTNIAALENYIQQGFANGFNCIDILVRYRANHYYVKNRQFNTYQHNEPFAGGASASNDPVQYAIDRGHELGMRVYGSFSTFLVTDGTNSYPSAMPSGSVTYMYNGGNPIPQTTTDDGSGLWADPGRADVRAHTINVLMDLVQNYDLDGIIFDRIRYQGTSFGYNPQALRDMGYNVDAPGFVYPAPGDATFVRRRQEAITQFLHDAYVAVTDLKPWMIVGTVPVAYSVGMTDTYERVMQFWPMWSAKPTANRTISLGAQDLIQPQFYRQWDSGGTNGVFNAPESNRVLMNKAVYGDLATEPMDFGLMPGANVNFAPLFATLTLSSDVDAQNTANAIAANICDTQTPSYFANGSGIFSADEVVNAKQGASVISRIRAATTACGPDVMSPAAPLSDFLMKEGWDNTPPLAVSGVTFTNNQYTVNVNWNAPGAAADGEGATHYLIYRSTSSAVKPYYENLANKAQMVTGTSFVDSGFPVSGSYYYRIVPVDDYNNKGPSTVVGPVAVQSTTIIVESRTAAGAKTPDASYTESIAMADTTSKSSAEGLVATGSRYSGNVNMVATFKPNLPVTGKYNVFITLDDSVSGPSNNALTEYTITGSGSPVVGQIRLVGTNTNLANKWLQLAAEVPFAAGTTGNIALKNLDGDGSGPLTGNRFVMDAVRFELVGSNVTDWQLY